MAPQLSFWQEPSCCQPRLVTPWQRKAGEGLADLGSLLHEPVPRHHKSAAKRERVAANCGSDVCYVLLHCGGLHSFVVVKTPLGT